MDNEFSIKEYIEEKFKENKEAHDAILNQVKFTNGKVKSLHLWKNFIIGFLTCFTVFSAVFVYAGNSYVKELIRDLIREENQIAKELK